MACVDSLWCNQPERTALVLSTLGYITSDTIRIDFSRCAQAQFRVLQYLHLFRLSSVVVPDRLNQSGSARGGELAL